MFADHLDGWRAYTDSPWGRLRYAVTEKILAGHAAEMGGSLRILDVGGGDGQDSVPLAAAGHGVTIADPAAGWLAEAERRAARSGVSISTVEVGLDDLPVGEWDLVLCHFVLQYRPAAAADVAALAERLRPGGRLSVILPNPDGMVLRQLVVDGPAAALTELTTESQQVVTFDMTARKVSVEGLDAELAAAGLAVAGRYGLRIANDLLVDNGPKHEPGYFERLLELELALAGREPFSRIGAAYMTVAEKRTD